ncbi:MAG TPA: molybdopterin-binding protein, partial [Solirubrobacterales bacterium]|nr:molybdopterin-binding protein [Solirubrobacterales bacterium]
MSEQRQAGPVRAGIVVTGTEVLTGVIADRNGPWVSERLGELGVEVAYCLCVADRAEDLSEALEFLRRAGVEIVITTGGLGPTADDLTAEVVARFAGRPLRLDAEMEARIAAILEGFARRAGFDPEALAEANRKQAMVPEGAIALDPEGTAPGLVVPAAEQVIVVLPGPPRELRPMWKVAIAEPPFAEALARATPLHSHRMRLFGSPESEIARSLREIEAEGVDLDRVEITTCLRKGEMEIDLRWREGAEPAARAVREGLARRHPRELYSPDGQTIDEMLGDATVGRRLAVAESCTGGGLGARLT